MEVNILYATVTGNSEDVAANIKTALENAGLNANIENLADLNPINIKDYKNIVMVTSTWGDGEPPMDSQDFYDRFMESDIKMSETNYAVFGLGESIYEKFCQTAIDYDQQLQKLGANRLLDVEKADGEAEEYLNSWIPKLIAALKI